MRCPKCGHEKWSAHQVVHSTVEVNEFGNYEGTIEDYYAGNPFGPYTCMSCGHTVDEIDNGLN